MLQRRLAVIAAVAAVGLVTAVPLAGAALAATAGEHVSADGTSPLGPVRFSVSALPDGSLEGDFVADVTLGGDTVLVHAEGPPTCLTVEGTKAAFIYRVTSFEPLPTAEPQAVYVSLEEGADDAHHIAFAGPAPIADLGTCPVGPAPLEFDGEMDVTDAG